MATEQADNRKRDAHGRFVKGESGNPGGRPASEFNFTSLLRVKASERPHVVDRLLDLCESEDENVALRAILGLANRLDGMPKQALEATGKDGGPIALKWDDGSTV